MADSALNAERNAKNYLEMSFAHWFAGNIRSSLTYADSALAIAGDDTLVTSQIQFRRAEAYGNLGEREKEREAYSAIVDLGIDDYVRGAKESIALSYFVEGKYEEALAAMPDSLSKEGKTCYKLIREYLNLDYPDESDYILVEHLWKPLLVARFLTPAYSEPEAVSWAKAFQRANQRDTVWRDELTTFGNARRFMAVQDFLGAWHGEYWSLSKNNLRKTEWRLLQYDTTAAVPESICDKVLHLKEVYEDILDYGPGSVDDENDHAMLALDFRYYYLNTLYDVIRQSVNAKAEEALRVEQANAEMYHNAMSQAYQKIDGSPSGENGSSYPYRCGKFGMADFDMEIDAQEQLMKSLSGRETAAGLSTVTREDVIKEYDTFASTFKDDEYSFPAKERTAALMKSRSAWLAWMKARDAVSALLSGSVKETYDRATTGIYNHQLKTLKNEFYVFGGLVIDRGRLNYSGPEIE